ncbi:MAG: sigma-70 family RNA polymerase sigma factor [Bacteroidaceae bacterium]|nr:sigma-70 family RNA polymerase sigma factor [Bacteroidaceae bacterium]
MDYTKMTDRELIERIVAKPVDEAVHNYFLKVQCEPFLRHVAKNILNEDNVSNIWGEFYEFISANDWSVLRNFSGKNNSSLCTYLSNCAVHYFLKVRKKNSRIVCVDMAECDVASLLDSFSADKEEEYSMVWQAFDKLKERDRLLLREMVINERSALDVADEIWRFVRSAERDWRKLPVKRVQDTISMMKRRALMNLLEQLKGSFLS